jgi:hypothetical protein
MWHFFVIDVVRRIRVLKTRSIEKSAAVSVMQKLLLGCKMSVEARAHKINHKFFDHIVVILFSSFGARNDETLCYIVLVLSFVL